jgi:hypothetical protein
MHELKVLYPAVKGMQGGKRSSGTLKLMKVDAIDSKNLWSPRLNVRLIE